MIDGATRTQAMLLVVLPLAMPGVVSVGIYLFITPWNEHLFALMMTGRNVRTVTVALQLFVGENQNPVGSADNRWHAWWRFQLRSCSCSHSAASWAG
jgi:ABC-type glycerol-3-phosphate transport system permease component